MPRIRGDISEENWCLETFRERKGSSKIKVKFMKSPERPWKDSRRVLASAVLG